MGEPNSEDAWLALVDEASRSARDLDERINVIEKYKSALDAEPWSNTLWIAYCEWLWSLYTDCRDPDAGWPEVEQQVGQEYFTLQTTLGVWEQGAAATQFRINDSHELWNRWITIELEELAKLPTQAGVERIRKIFFDRLQTPHATWDETSQMFSTFISKYDNASWESTMVQVTQMATPAKHLYGQREEHELKLQQAIATGDETSVASVMKQYLEWESLESSKKPKKGLPSSPLILAVALYERALSSTILGRDPGTWEDYLVFISSSYALNSQAQLPSALHVAKRATKHCPWSGMLWARRILIAETENLEFPLIEEIKHEATSAGVLDRDGMNGIIEIYIAWCGYLKRRTMFKSLEDEAYDVADVGLRGALETVQDLGERYYGKQNYTGDVLFRIERIVIQYFTQKGAIREARDWWKQLTKKNQRSYEFWQQYYFWEMYVRNPNTPPTLASEVLLQAVRTKDLDYPEMMMDVYVRHCTNYEDAQTLLAAKDTVSKQAKGVAKRRAREQAIYAQQHPEVIMPDPTVGDSPGNTKRKRESTAETADGNTHKKIKNEQPEADPEALRQQHLKRDRENTTVLVTNLPPEVTQTKVRQYFKEYGHINSLTVKTEADKLSSTALIEFRSNDDVQSAFLRDGKFFGEKQIKVESGTGLTLYVTNYAPSADEKYMHELFKDCGEIFSIRWPSLKFNTHRRFCYVTFRTAEAASAATSLDGKLLDNKFKLVAKYSDPAGKKQREGAAAEGRELHITSLDSSLAEDDLKGVFSKYGNVEAVRLLRTAKGESKGAGFIVFEKKDDATAALELDKTKLKSSVLHVELTQVRNFKTIATSASPAPETDGHSAMSLSPASEHSHINTHALHASSKPEGANRTITLLNVPDTVNDARIRAIAEPFGRLTKVVLRPDHQGAIVEYEDVASAGRASLGLENHEIAPGRKLKTGGLKDLFTQTSEIKTDRIQVGQGGKNGNTFIQPSAPVRRPGGRGGLGQKRGLGFTGAKSGASVAASSNLKSNGNENKPLKSNADFKAMFLSGGKE